jgi:NHL repeat
MRISRKLSLSAATIVLTMLATVPPALAETHPFTNTSFGRTSTEGFSNPNGIAVDESSGDVYVADDTGVNEQQTVSIEGGPTGGSFTLEFKGQKTSLLTVSGAGAPAAGEVQAALEALSTIGSGNVAVSEELLPGTVVYTVTFQGVLGSTALPSLVCDGFALTGGTSPACTVATMIHGAGGKVYKFDSNGNPVNFSALAGNELTGAQTPATSFAFPTTEPGNPAAVAVDNSTDPSEPSKGDLYVMDFGHNVIDKFSPTGAYLSEITGPFSGGLLGLGVDAGGTVHVDTNAGIDVFDDSTANGFVRAIGGGEGRPAYGFATGGQPASDYPLFACGCMQKLGADGTGFGPVDSGTTAVAAAVDPASGHLYIDDQSSVSEWDTGEMDGGQTQGSVENGRLLSSFGGGRLTEASGKQGGIAVNGASGNVYVSNPADGKVYVFASTTPAAAAAAPANVTETTGTLHGTVDPRGVPVISCEFQYGASGSLNTRLPLHQLSHTAGCVNEQGEPITGATSPVAVHADISGLLPGTLYHFRLVAGNANGSSPSGRLFPTLTAGFGIKSFEVAFLNRDGTPDVQAGSHPYKLLLAMAFDTQVVGDERYTYLPMGNVKDLTFHFPPGLVGDPNATTKQCTLNELIPISEPFGSECPAESEIGQLEPEYDAGFGEPANEATGASFALVPPPGVAFQFASHLLIPNVITDVGVPAGGDSGLVATVEGAPATVAAYGFRQILFGGTPVGSTKPFLTMPTACNGPLTSTVKVDSYQNPGHFAEASSMTRDAAGAPAGMSGCAQLAFPPTIETKPDVPNTSSASGLAADVHVSQKATKNPEGLAESTLRDTKVVLPPGMALNPAGADGLGACSEGLVGFTGFTEFNPLLEPGDRTATFTPELPDPLRPGTNFCPNGSKVGTAKLRTPLLTEPLVGSVYLATQEVNPFQSLIAMYMVIDDPVSGTLVKVPFQVRLCATAVQIINGVSCHAPGQIVATAVNSPEVPFEDLELHFYGGERAPLRTPSRCGTYTTDATFTPWSGTAPVNTSSSFLIEHGPHGSPCPGASLPFNPAANAGSTNLQAGEFSPFTLSMIRHDGEQNVQSVTATLPPGLSGMLSNIELCPEPQANEGTCPPGSEIGETTVSVGVGSHPFVVTGGRDYLTVPYNGADGCTMGSPGCAPFGLTFEVPAKAGPFDLERTVKHHPACDCVVVRGKVEIDPITSALTITSDPPGSPHAIPTMLEGIPLEVQQVNATTTRSNFQFNPTSCAKTKLAGTLYSSERAQDAIELPYQVTNCASLKFEPKFRVSTSGRTSKANGASLTAKVSYPKVPQGTDANIAKVKVELPKQLPSRLTTLQKACTAKQFEVNPAGCPAASKIGYAVVHTPILPVPLQGPAIFVSHGGEAFPSLTMVLQGDNVTIDLVGTTFISKAGITSTDFKAVPDQPFSTFELTLPQGKFSALTANGNLCAPTKTVLVKRMVTIRVKGHKKTVTRKVHEIRSAPLSMPTEFVAQNGAVIHRTTKIAITGCPKKVKKKSGKRHSSHRHGRAIKKK